MPIYVAKYWVEKGAQSQLRSLIFEAENDEMAKRQAHEMIEHRMKKSGGHGTVGIRSIDRLERIFGEPHPYEVYRQKHPLQKVPKETRYI